MFRQNGWSGIHVTGPSALKCSQAKLKANGRNGLVAEDGAAVSARHLDVDANTGTGILAAHAATVVDLFGCTSAGNRIGLSSTASRVCAINCRVVCASCAEYLDVHPCYLSNHRRWGLCVAPAHVLVGQVRNMCNVLEEQGGLVQVDLAKGGQRQTSELLPRIETRGAKVKAVRPATPLKKLGERSRRRDASSSANAGSDAEASGSLPLLGAAAACPPL